MLVQIATLSGRGMVEHEFIDGNRREFRPFLNAVSR